MPRRKSTPEHEYGQGSVYQRQDGRWVVALTLGGKRQYRYFPDERTARRWRDQVAATPDYREPSRESVADYLDRWIERRTALVKLAPTSVVQYQLIARQVRELGFDKVQLGKLRPHHVDEVLAALAARMAPATVRRHRTVLSTALRDAVALELLPSNPVAATRTPRLTQSTEQRVWDGEQIQQFLSANTDDRLIALWTLLLAIGCRDGEARGLLWTDLNQRDETLTIQRNLSQKGARDGPTKSRRSRVVPLPPELVEALRAHRARQLAERLQSGKAWADSGRIFVDAHGRPMTNTQTTYWFQLATERAGLPRIRVHDLRHTAATALLSQSVPVATVASILGHANPSITMRVYAHVLPQDLRSALAAMRRTLGLHTPRDRSETGP